MIDDSMFASVMVTQAEILDRNKELMDKEIEALSKTHFVKIKGFAEEGYPSDSIRKMAAEKHADLIVMGVKGKGKSNSVFGKYYHGYCSKIIFPYFCNTGRCSL